MVNHFRPIALTVILCLLLSIWLTKILATQPSQNSKISPTKKNKIDYSKFTHASHEGKVKKLGTQSSIILDCNYCHIVQIKDTKIGKYPCETSDQIGKSKSKVVKHSSCIECHRSQFFSSTPDSKAMCLICHSQYGRIPNLPVRRFPNPFNPTQFGESYSHKTHKDIVLVATASEKKLMGSKFNCAACHVIDTAGKFASLPQHGSCFVCHIEKTESSYTSAEPFYSNCRGCHTPLNQNLSNASVRTPTYHLIDLFPHSRQHSISEKLPNVERELTCNYCHVNISKALTRDKIAESKRTEFLLPSYIACASCHGYKKPKVIRFIPREGKSGEIFTVNDCERCHTPEVAAKDLPADHKPPKKQSLDSEIIP